jgi:leader peptidase (prepilin peptidase)/N-methyltransferase
MIFIIAIYGLIFGSFATCLVERLGHDEGFIKKPSHCPKCKHRLGLSDLIPIFSYVFLKGKCRYCNKKIEKKYFIIELLMSLSFVLAYKIAGENLEFFLTCALFFVLITIVFVDLKFMIIPHLLNFLLFLISLIYCFFYYSQENAIIMPAIGFLIGFSISKAFEKIRGKEGLGFGDIIFITAGFPLIFPINIPVFFFFAGVFGIVFSLALKENKFPFAPALCFSLLICFFMQKFGLDLARFIS